MFKYAGKLFLIRPGSLDVEEKTFYKDLSFPHFIFFKEHFKEEFKAYLEKLKQDLNLGFLAVDQEGGRVCRIEGDFIAPLEVAKLYEKKGEGIARSWAEKIADVIKKVGLNLNLAPCVDLEDESAEEFLKTRTFGRDPDLVIELGRVFIEEHRKQRIFTCIKHFPGLKGVRVDPHRELPLKEELDEKSLNPFEVLCKQKGVFIMSTHILIKELENAPVTFSEKAMKLLRTKLNYRGLVFTDDLNMDALRKWELEERIILSIASGHNILIFCGDWRKLANALFNIKSEFERSQVLKKKIKESFFILEKCI